MFTSNQIRPKDELWLQALDALVLGSTGLKGSEPRRQRGRGLVLYQLNRGRRGKASIGGRVYLHTGAPKFWYTIDLDCNEKFEQLASAYFSDLHKECPEFLRHKTTLIEPHILLRNGIRMRKLVQRQREFVISPTHRNSPASIAHPPPPDEKSLARASICYNLRPERYGRREMSKQTATHAVKMQGEGPVYDHVVASMNSVSEVKMALRHATRELLGRASIMLSAPDQCQWMEMMVKLTGARRGIEIGVFTGYSALCFALGLPEDGQLIACDIDERFVSVGRPFWEQAGVAHKIQTMIGPALDSLAVLAAQPGAQGSYDFAYIDADKGNYLNYAEMLLPLLKQNGYIIIDNTIWFGQVADPQRRQTDPDTAAIHNTVQSLLADNRVEVCTLMLADGVTIVRKK